MSLEGGDFYQDKIIRDQNVIEGQEERAAIDERLERAEVSHEVVGSIEDLHRNTELDAQVQENLSFLDGITSTNEEGKEVPILGFDVFSHYLLHDASFETKSQFIDFKKNLTIENNIKKFGKFPINDFESDQFFIDGVSDIEAAVVATDTEVITTGAEVVATGAEVVATDANIEKLLTDLHSFKEGISTLNLSNPRLIQLLSGLPNEVNDSNREFINESGAQIASVLRSNNLIETEILPQAQAQGPEAYAQVRNSLISIGGGEDGSGGEFEARILAWEMTPDDFGELPAEQMVRVSGALGTRVDEIDSDADIEQSGNIFTLTTSDGTEINYDVVTNERTLEVDGYSLNSQVEDTGDYQTPKLEYMKAEQEHLPKLQKISAAGSMIEQAQVEDDDVDGIKSILKGEEALGYSYYLELGIEAMKSAGDIKDALKTAYDGHNTPLEEARDEYRDEILRLRDTHVGALAKKDKKVKETLRYFESIGFTEIPQYITDQIVDTLNSNDALAAQLGFTEQIDFSNGELGIDTIAGETEGIDLQDKKAFAEFVNKMMGVDAINVAIIGSGAPVGDRNKFKTQLQDSGLLDVGGFGKAMENLSRVEQTPPTENPHTK